MSLDPTAVREANRELWEAYPELNGRLLTMEPEDAGYRVEWMRMYKEVLADQPDVISELKPVLRFDFR